MKTTIDLPEALLTRAKVVAAQRRTTLKELVRSGLDWAICSGGQHIETRAPLERLTNGLHLGCNPLRREQAHERR